MADGPDLEQHHVTVVPESSIAGLLNADDAFDAVEACFAAMARGGATNFPVIRQAIGHEDALYGFKSGFDRESLAMGLKSGGYWPGNGARGLTNHQSTVILFDADTGRAKALVGGNLLTALRTAAASAVSVAHLARKDAKVLGMIGAGHQSAYQMEAVAAQRDFEAVVGWNYHPEMLSRLERTADALGLPFRAVSREELCAEADVIVTITSSFEPQIMADWVRPGTHLACMGTDTKGKQEVDPALLARAAVFTDEVAQSVTLGEAQHAVARGLLTESDIVAIGAVINGTAAGRVSDDQITVFDGTGVGLQDLAVAAKAVALAEARGIALKVPF